VWDLTRLAKDDASALAAAQESLKAAKVLAVNYRKSGPPNDAAAWNKLFQEIDEVAKPLAKAYQYAYLRLSADTASQDARDLRNAVVAIVHQVNEILDPVSQLWNRQSKGKIDALVQDPVLAPDAYSLKRIKALSRYSLEGKRNLEIYGAASVLVDNWISLHNEISSQVVKIKWGGASKTQALGALSSFETHPIRTVRRLAEKTLIEAMVPHVLPASYCLDSLVAWRIGDAKLRRIDDPLERTRMDFQIDKPALDLALNTAESAYPLFQGWLKKKQAILKLPKFGLYDTSAPLGELPTFSFYEARLTLLQAFGGLSPEFAEMARQLFLNRRYHAEPQTRKQSGAFCMNVADGLPFILLNFKDDLDSLKTLFHETGHGVHDMLTNLAQSSLSDHPSTVVAEIASTFAEGLLFELLIGAQTSPEKRQVLTAWRVDCLNNTIVRQAMFSRFEERAYATRRAGESLTADRLSAMYLEESKKLYGPGIQLPENYEQGWAAVPHFIRHVYYPPSYVSAGLLSLLLLRNKNQDLAAFAPAFKTLLSAGGSNSTPALLSAVGIDVTKAETWTAALGELELLMKSVDGPDAVSQAA
jgi:oligoendopeptidase F